MKEIHLWGVKQNNLKNIEVKIPLGKMTVICGPSGSGKSSLAFETLFAEGQRRFIESMSNYARQFLNKAPKPDIEGVTNIPPAISIEQKNTVRSSRSTVGTTTELVDYLRLLFEKIGVSYCPEHKVPTEKQSITEATDKVLKNLSGLRGYILVEVPVKDRIVDGKKLISLLLQDGYLRLFKFSNSEETVLTKKKSTGKLKTKLQSVAKRDTQTKQLNGEIFELADHAKFPKNFFDEDFCIVIDRLSFSAEEKGRLADSLTQAYAASIKYNLKFMVRRALVLSTEGKLLKLSEEPCCPICSYTPPPINSKLFSFNSPIGACPQCKGFGNILDIDEKKVVPNARLSVAAGALNPFTMPSAAMERRKLLDFCRKKKIDLHKPWQELPTEHRKMIWNGDPQFMGVVGLFEYLEQIKYKMHVRVFISRYRSAFTCPSCRGTRLCPEVNHIFISGKNINDLTSLTLEDLRNFFLKIELNPHQKEIAKEVLKQIQSRLDFLVDVGVHYLTMSRETRTLSGGEYQRLILANQLGMGLSQTLYVLDEPTVGLHPRDNDRLIKILKGIRDLGNTLVIVEHDQDVIRSSEHIVEMGPGSGYLGGQLVFSGSIDKFLTNKDSLTAQYLHNANLWHPPREVRPVDMDTYKFKLNLKGARGNNLKNLDVEIPLRRLVAITGVSGSGKSTLITKTLYPALAKELNVDHLPHQEYESLTGFEHIKNVLMIDQSPIGKSARSSPITYLKAFDAIRNLMASTPEAKAAGYTPGTFSLNVDGGRCPACKGTGFEEIDMMFMDNVVIPCDVCDGKKYRSEILEVNFRGKNIYEILQLTVAEAMGFFVAHPNIRKPLSVLKEVGLDYLSLGQPANSLSGGESQRLKIAKELSFVQQKSTLYILDEPTTGLHFREVDILMNVLNKLIEGGGSVIVVEHNLDVIRGADYVLDLGPEAGKRGGQIVASGSPEDIMRTHKSLTGQYLTAHLGGLKTKIKPTQPDTISK